MIKPEDRPEFIGEIIDIFEDFLEERGITINNPEKHEDGDDENAAIIYGSDYGELQTQLEGLMAGWGILKNE